MGMAIDVMIPNYQTQAGKELGDRIATFALANANHYTHVPIATGGGYPNGTEICVG